MAAPARVSTSFENPGAPTEGPQSCGQRLMGSKASSQGCEVYNSPSDQPQHQKTSRERLLQTHFDPCTPSRMVSRKTVAALLVVHTAAMLATQTEAFVPIFTYGELQKMQERERNKGQKKSLSIWQRSGEEGPADPTEPIEEEENKMIELTAPVEIGIRMNSRQLEKYRAALEELLSEMSPSTQPSDGHAGKKVDRFGRPLPPE
uniref:Promotilin n=2 Tax=Callithrix jacchus TaxID=9483 RepID=F6WZH6_CALJA